MNLGLNLLVLLMAVSPATSQGGDSPKAFPKPCADRMEQLAALLGVKGPLSASCQLPGRDCALFSIADGDGTRIGYTCVTNTEKDPAICEVIFDSNTAGALEENAVVSAQRAIGTTKVLGERTFVHDGLFSYNLCFQYKDKATGKLEGEIAVDALTARLSLPGGDVSASIAAPAKPPTGTLRLLQVPRYEVRHGYRPTALAMLFGYLADHGFPDVGRKRIASGLQTEAQYIEEFAVACGACSERTATELFVTGRGLMAKIDTVRVSEKYPSKDLIDRIVAELDAGRPMFVRVTTANVNHYFIVCGYVQLQTETFLVGTVPLPEGAGNGTGGLYFFSLPAAFESAEFVMVGLLGKK